MAPSRRLSTQKKTAAAKKKDKTAKTRRTPRGAKQDDRDSDYAIGPTDDEEESDSETGAQILTKQTIPTQAAKKIKEKDLEIFALKSALAKAQAGSSNTVLKKTKMTPEEKNWYNSIVTANKKFNWGKVKFCNSDSKLIGLTGNIFDKWNLKEFDGLGEKEKQEAKVSWVTRNKDLVRNAMNDARNYAQSRVRDWVVDRWIAGLMVPTPEQVMGCAMRQEEYHLDVHKKGIFDLYHDELLFKVLGKEHWDWWVRHYNPISGLKDDGSNLVEYNSEALVCALFENCWEKWKIIKENKQAGKVDKERKADVYKTEYIVKDGGVAKWGGWNKKGRDRVSELSRLVKEARAQDHVQEMEAACLERLRIKYKVAEREAKKGAKKKRKRPMVQEEDEDDEFDCL